jgi:hypothetical protein
MPVLLTVKFASQVGDLGVGIVDDLVHLRAQSRILVRETPR